MECLFQELRMERSTKELLEVNLKNLVKEDKLIVAVLLQTEPGIQCFILYLEELLGITQHFSLSTLL